MEGGCPPANRASLGEPIFLYVTLKNAWQRLCARQGNLPSRGTLLGGLSLKKKKKRKVTHHSTNPVNKRPWTADSALLGYISMA